MGNKRFTIGYLDENAYDEYHSFITSGLYDAALKYDMNIIRFGHFFSHTTSKDEAHAAKVLDFIEQFRLDGLIFLGWARAVAGENLEGFKNRFSYLPLISLGVGIQGIHSVVFQGDRYIKEMLLHLIEVHGLKRIAFIAPFWPDNRTAVYIELMKEYGIYLPELLVESEELQGLDVPSRGRRAVSLLLDKRRVEPEAIVSLYNDETKGIMAELYDRGLKVPDDIAVTSYEDGELGRFSSPSLTTVYFPWRELGFQAAEKMHMLLTQGDSPMTDIVRGRVIIRQSCGCTGESIKASGAGSIVPAELPFKEACRSGSEGLRKEVAARLASDTELWGLDTDALLEAFCESFKTRNSLLFLNELEMQLREVSRGMSGLSGAMASFRRHLIPFFAPYIKTEPEEFIRVENLLQQAQVLLQEKVNGEWFRSELEYRSIYLSLKEISQILITNFTVKNLMDSLEINLPRLGIPSCHIYSFKNTDVNEFLFDECTEEFDYHGFIRSKAARRDPMPVKNGLNGQLFREDRPHLIAAQLLYVGEEFFGFTMFEPGPLDIRIYQILDMNISTTLSGAILFEKLDAIYKRLVEQAHRRGMADISTGILHNIGNVLNTVSVSSHVIKEMASSTLLEDFIKANSLLENKLDDIEAFIADDPKGEKLMQYFIKLGDSLMGFQQQLQGNISRLSEKIGMIDDIITAQQNYTGIKSTLEEIDIIPVIEDVLKLNAAAVEKYGVRVVKEYKGPVNAFVQRTKLFQVLANLVKNAIEAMQQNGGDKRLMTISAESSEKGCFLRIEDNGHGIEGELMETIFAYGYTSKDGGHGFGLHSCANYMTEMEGRIWAESEGAGKGAAFVLQLKQR